MQRVSSNPDSICNSDKVTLEVESGNGYRATSFLDVTTARTLAYSLIAEAEKLEVALRERSKVTCVGVSFLENLGHSTQYTYIDPFGCKVGDIVLVDARGEEKTAVVRKTFRQTPNHAKHKTVLYVIGSEDLADAMSATR